MSVVASSGCGEDALVAGATRSVVITLRVVVKSLGTGGSVDSGFTPIVLLASNDVTEAAGIVLLSSNGAVDMAGMLPGDVASVCNEDDGESSVTTSEVSRVDDSSKDDAMVVLGIPEVKKSVASVVVII